MLDEGIGLKGCLTGQMFAVTKLRFKVKAGGFDLQKSTRRRLRKVHPGVSEEDYEKCFRCE